MIKFFKYIIGLVILTTLLTSSVDASKIKKLLFANSLGIGGTSHSPSLALETGSLYLLETGDRILLE